jgi:hypothetical protein
VAVAIEGFRDALKQGILVGDSLKLDPVTLTVLEALNFVVAVTARVGFILPFVILEPG